MSRRRGLACVVALALVGLLVGSDHARRASSDDLGPIAAGAAAARPAVRVRQPTSGDLVSVYESSDLSTTTRSAAQEVAASVGASSTVTSGFSVGMVALRRGSTVVQQAAGGAGVWQFPMGVSAMPVDAMRVVMGDRVASAVGAGLVTLSQSSATLRGAQQGDVLELVAANGSIVSFTIGLVATDAEVGGTEIVMSPEQAVTLGPVEPTRVLIYGAFDRSAIQMAFAARGIHDAELFGGRRVRMRWSWSPPDPDSTMGLVRTKQLLGEFDFTVGSTGVVSVDAAWRERSIVRVDFTDIRIRSNCHVAIVADLQAALTEVAQAGLAGAIDLANTNSYGGCYYPRFNRITGSLGFLSRHSWGQPIDMNTVSNAQGNTPRMDCRVVRIFRKHGFAWGGNFLTPDGMHFEWVGEPRHELQYASRYCPNLPGGAIQSLGGADAPAARPSATGSIETMRATFFADDAWATSGH